MAITRLFSWPLLLGIILMAGVLVAEVLTHVLGNVAYVAISAYALWLSRDYKQVIFISIFTTFLLIIGYLLAVTIYRPVDQVTFFVNRVSAVIVVWFAAYFTTRYQRSQAEELRQRKEIEESKLEEERLRSSQEMHEAIARNFPGGWIGILDQDLKYIFADGRGLSRVGLMARDIISKKFTTVLHADEIEPLLRDALDGKDVAFEIVFNRRTFEVNARPFLSRHKTNWTLVVIHDITSLKETEAGLIMALEKERELGELKSRFVTVASHEFRTPLTTILSSSYLLANYRSDKYQREIDIHLTRIKQSVKLLTGILNEFLSLGKLEEGEIKALHHQINIPAFLDELTIEAESLKLESQQLKINHSGDTKIVSDRQFLMNILLNILSNAFKYSRPNDLICLDAEAANGVLTARVTDQGIGIPVEDQRYIFQPFFRAHNAVNIQGAGLGLSIVKKYVNLLNGSINFTSTHNEGTVFTVSVPMSDHLN